MRRLTTGRSTAPPRRPRDLDDETILLLLLGNAAPVGVVPRLMFVTPHPTNPQRVATLWNQHREFLLFEANRLRLPRPKGGYYGEACAQVAQDDDD